MSSNFEYNAVADALPIASLQYRDIAGFPLPTGEGDSLAGDASRRQSDTELSEAALTARILEERTAAVREVEQKLRQEYEQKLVALRRTTADAILDFTRERNDYFARLEAEIVQLSLAIAAKILHREAQVDPMLVATLVRIAAEKLRDASSITVRTRPERAESWKQYFAAFPNLARVEVVEDATLAEGDCILETELGAANFGLDAQLKEVEQGFFDLLALRPPVR